MGTILTGAISSGCDIKVATGRGDRQCVLQQISLARPTHRRYELQLASTVLVPSSARRAALCDSVDSRPRKAKNAAAL